MLSHHEHCWSEYQKIFFDIAWCDLSSLNNTPCWAPADRHAERLHYLGVSYGLTQQLFNFWHRGGYRPVYLRQSPSETTGEHTCVMLKPLEHPDVVGTGWLEPFVTDFKVGTLGVCTVCVCTVQCVVWCGESKWFGCKPDNTKVGCLHAV